LEYQQQAETEFKQTLTAAEAGDAMAQRMLWIKYLAGHGVKRDEDKANFWLKTFEHQKDAFLGELKQRADAGDREARIQHLLLSAKSALDDPKNFLPEGEDNSRWLEKEKQKTKRTSPRGKHQKQPKAQRTSS
jgi:TPR repeat protein